MAVQLIRLPELGQIFAFPVVCKISARLELTSVIRAMVQRRSPDTGILHQQLCNARPADQCNYRKQSDPHRRTPLVLGWSLGACHARDQASSRS